MAPGEDLFTVAAPYVDAVRRAGAVSIIAPHPVDERDTEALIEVCDALIITGGQDMDPAFYGAANEASVDVQPEADAADLKLLSVALDRGLPVLGVCRGIQVINVAFGGDLLQQVQTGEDPDHPVVIPAENHHHRHTIEIEPRSRLGEIYGAGPHDVGSLHHQAIGRLGVGLRAVARTNSGVIEAVEATDHDLIAVQWHPELIDEGEALFVDLVDRAR